MSAPLPGVFCMNKERPCRFSWHGLFQDSGSLGFPKLLHKRHIQGAQKHENAGSHNHSRDGAAKQCAENLCQMIAEVQLMRHNMRALEGTGKV